MFSLVVHINQSMFRIAVYTVFVMSLKITKMVKCFNTSDWKTELPALHKSYSSPSSGKINAVINKGTSETGISPYRLQRLQEVLFPVIEYGDIIYNCSATTLHKSDKMLLIT